MSGVFQKRFNTFRHRVGVSDPEAVFHSFRHTWRDALREARVSEEMAQCLGGWRGSGQDKMYGNGFSAWVLRDALRKVAYPGVNLSHLYVPR
jgi:integrase